MRKIKIDVRILRKWGEKIGKCELRRQPAKHTWRACKCKHTHIRTLNRRSDTIKQYNVRIDVCTVHARSHAQFTIRATIARVYSPTPFTWVTRWLTLLAHFIRTNERTTTNPKQKNILESIVIGCGQRAMHLNDNKWWHSLADGHNWNSIPSNVIGRSRRNCKKSDFTKSSNGQKQLARSIRRSDKRINLHIGDVCRVNGCRCIRAALTMIGKREVFLEE